MAIKDKTTSRAFVVVNPAGRASVPGGWQEVGESGEEAAYRELHEEAGIRRDPQHWVMRLRRGSGSGASGALFSAGEFDFAAMGNDAVATAFASRGTPHETVSYGYYALPSIRWSGGKRGTIELWDGPPCSFTVVATVQPRLHHPIPPGVFAGRRVPCEGIRRSYPARYRRSSPRRLRRRCGRCPGMWTTPRAGRAPDDLRAGAVRPPTPRASPSGVL